MNGLDSKNSLSHAQPYYIRDKSENRNFLALESTIIENFQSIIPEELFQRVGELFTIIARSKDCAPFLVFLPLYPYTLQVFSEGLFLLLNLSKWLAQVQLVPFSLS